MSLTGSRMRTAVRAAARRAPMMSPTAVGVAMLNPAARRVPIMSPIATHIAMLSASAT